MSKDSVLGFLDSHRGMWFSNKEISVKIKRKNVDRTTNRLYSDGLLARRKGFLNNEFLFSSPQENRTQFIASIILIIAYIAAGFAGYNIARSNYNDAAIAHAFESFVVQSSDDNFSRSVADNCRNISVYEEQVDCVVNSLNNVSFQNHLSSFRSPSVLIKEGGVCRDMVTAYASIFNNIGWQHSFNFPLSDHVFLSVSKQIDCSSVDMEGCAIYCNIDWSTYSCYRLGSSREGFNVTKKE